MAFKSVNCSKSYLLVVGGQRLKIVNDRYL